MDFQYKRNRFKAKDIDATDTGIRVKDALVLIQQSDYYDDIYASLKVDEIINDTIEIPGARKLIEAVDTESKRYYKVDVDKKYEELSFSASPDESNILLKFGPSENYPVDFTALPIYSAQSDFFENSCSMSKYANRLIKNERIEVVLDNLERIRSIYAEGREHHEYKYRILRDDKGNHFFRASTSTTHYKDYNIGLSVFVALVSLHRHMKTNEDQYSVNRCEYTESEIRVFFEKRGHRSTKIGDIKYLVELNNSEIKEGAVRFSGVFSILVEDNKADRDAIQEEKRRLGLPIEDDYIPGGQRELLLKPRPARLKYSIASIKHNVNPQRAIPAMSLSSKLRDNEKQIYADLETLGDPKSLGMIRNSIAEKLQRIQTESELGEFKSIMQRSVPEAIQNYHELLRLMNRLDLIAEDSVEAKEQLRYLFYEALLDRRNPGFGQTEA
jgi:hypothetical protein